MKRIMAKCIVIVGRSCTGKDFLLNFLTVKKLGNFRFCLCKCYNVVLGHINPNSHLCTTLAQNLNNTGERI